MPALYNIGRIKANKVSPRKDFQDFLGSLVLMIPSEIVALYFVGRGFAEQSPIIPIGLWGLLCWIIVLPSRLLGMTEQPSERFGQATKWINLAISLIAFPAWVFALGSPMLNFSVDHNTASLIVLVISVVGAWFYTNPQPPKKG